MRARGYRTALALGCWAGARSRQIRISASCRNPRMFQACVSCSA